MPRIRLKLQIEVVIRAVQEVAIGTHRLMRDQYEPFYWSRSWTNGGCWMFASALRRVLSGSRLYTVYATWSEDPGDLEDEPEAWDPQHIVCYWRGLFWDAEGAHTGAALIRLYSKGCTADAQLARLPEPNSHNIWRNNNLSAQVAGILREALAEAA